MVSHLKKAWKVNCFFGKKNFNVSKGFFEYPMIQIYGSLSTKFNLKISFDIFRNLNISNFISLNKNENLDENHDYYFFIPIQMSKSCNSGQFWDISK